MASNLPGSGGTPINMSTSGATPTNSQVSNVHEQSQPVDLAKQPLRIPSVRPSSLNQPRPGGVAILSTNPVQIRGPSRPPLLAVPKASSVGQQVNLAVMNKVTVLTSNPPSKATPLPGNMPRATATTIIRPPTSYPLNIKTTTGIVGTGPSLTPGGSIRLTTGANPGQSGPVQLVPMSSATIRGPSGATTRPATATFRPSSSGTTTAFSDAVRVTLVQSPGSSPKVGGNPLPITSSSAQPSIYKQVTINTSNQMKPTLGGQPSMRISGGMPATSRMTVLPAPLQLTTQGSINVPLAPMGARAITGGGKLISVPGSATSGPPSTNIQGVTIQKTSIPVNSSQRSISLPYGTAPPISSAAKPASQAIPVARVCPQQNVVTITTTVGSAINTSVPVYLARPPPSTQSVAINLSSPVSSLNLTKAPLLGPSSSAPKTLSIGGQGSARIVSIPQPIPQSLDDKISSPSRPSILRRREGDRDVNMPETPPPRPDSRNDDAGSSSSGSTTLSATSSPGMAADRANLSGGEEQSNLQPSPRKKPRKQTLTSTSVRPGSDQQWEDQQKELKRKTAKPQLPLHAAAAELNLPDSPPKSNYIKDMPHMSLLNSYRHTWKSRHNHFLRHSDVRPREEQRPTVNELANQKHINQKINGWKIYHLTSQMEDIIDVETELTSRLSGLQKRLDKHSLHELTKDVGKIHELIKANLQRSKVIQDQIKESKDHALELFEHKSRVSDILHKYMSKRPLKKRELKIMS